MEKEEIDREIPEITQSKFFDTIQEIRETALVLQKISDDLQSSMKRLSLELCKNYQQIMIPDNDELSEEDYSEIELHDTKYLDYHKGVFLDIHQSKPNSLRKIHVLIIHEDILIIDRFMHELFQSGYFQVTPFLSLPSAMTLVESLSYGLILVSENLIIKNSSCNIKDIKRLNPSIPVFAIVKKDFNSIHYPDSEIPIFGIIMENSTTDEIIDLFLEGFRNRVTRETGFHETIS